MQAMRLVLGVSLAVASLALLAGCDIPIVSPSAGDMTQEALKNLSNAKYVEYRNLHVAGLGGLVPGQDTLAGDMQITRSGDQKDVFTYQGSQVDVLVVGGKPFVKAGGEFWKSLPNQSTDPALMTKIFPDHWASGSLTPIDALSKGGAALARLDSLQVANPGKLSKSSAGTVNGASAVKIASDRLDAYVTTSRPFRVVRIAYHSGYADADGFHDFQADIDYPKSLDLASPTDYVDADDPSTLPARFRLVDQHAPQETCSAESCPVSADLRNDGGKSVGQAVVTFHALRQQSEGQEFASCSANIPAAAHDQVETVNCTFNDSNWRNYQKTSWFLQVTIKNPIWDD